MWVLILIMLSSEADVKAVPIGSFEMMNDCFEARETLLIKSERFDGYFKAGEQAICVQVI